MNPKRRPLIAGNWKLHKTVRESVQHARDLRNKLAAAHDAEVMVAPVYTALYAVHEALEGSRIALGAQDCHWEAQGAFTGEVSAPLLADVGCSYVIVGHSERRQLFVDTDEIVNKKAQAVVDSGLTAVVCVGETLEQRESGKTLGIVMGQIEQGFAGLSAGQMQKVVIAYEPVWAIGTGKNASPADAQEVHGAIRNKVEELYGAGLAAGMRILYGGSVKPDNAAALFGQADIDGALVGGASLQVESFVAIARAAG